jgi:hypothetical protein
MALTLAQFNEFSQLTGDVFANHTLQVSENGTYDLSQKTIASGVNYDVDASATTGAVTLIANNAGGETLTGGTGTDTLTGGTGATTFVLNSNAGSVTGHSGSDTLTSDYGNITGVDVTGIKTLDMATTANLILTEDQLNEFSNLTGVNWENHTLEVTAPGTCDLSQKTIASGVTFDLDASGSTGAVTLIGGNQAGEVLSAGTGSDTLKGATGYTSYNFGSSFGQDVIDNTANTSGAPQGEIDFNYSTGISDQNLWFQRSGNNLLVDVLGTNDQIDVSGWFGSNAAAQVQSIDASGLKLDTQVAQLVSAMASYAANNSGFNPATATSMPTDPTLQNAIAAAWHA